MLYNTKKSFGKVLVVSLTTARTQGRPAVFVVVFTIKNYVFFTSPKGQLLHQKMYVYINSRFVYEYLLRWLENRFRFPHINLDYVQCEYLLRGVGRLHSGSTSDRENKRQHKLMILGYGKQYIYTHIYIHIYIIYVYYELYIE